MQSTSRKHKEFAQDRAFEGAATRAKNSVEVGHQRQALHFWRVALSRQPSNLQARNGVANALLALNMLEDATAVFGAIANDTPKSPHGLVGLAKCAMARRDFTTAEGYWQNCIDRWPRNQMVRLAHGNALLERDRVAEADAEFAVVESVSPNLQAGQIGRIKCAIRAGQTQIARERLIAILKENPSSFVARLRYAKLLLQMGDTLEAETEFGRIVVERPHDPRGLCGLAECAMADDDLALAEQRWRDTRRRFPWYLPAIEALAGALFDNGKVTEAKNLYLTLAARVGHDPRPQISLAKCASALGDRAGAEEIWKEAINRFSGHLYVRRGYALALLSEARLEDAVKQFEGLVRTYPNELSGWVGLIETETFRRCFAVASEHAEETLKRFPESRRAWLLAVQALCNNNQVEQAKTLVDNCSLISGDDRLLIQEHFLKCMGPYLNFEEFEVRFRNIEKEKIPSPGLISKYSNYLLRSGRFDQSRNLLRAAINACSTSEKRRMNHLRRVQAREHVFFDEETEANTIIEQLKSDKNIIETEAYMDLRIWSACKRNDLEEARRLFLKMPSTKTNISLHLERARLVGVSSYGSEHQSGALKLFTRMRNQVLIIPEFLQHYREIGINEFTIVDNGSDDGTSEYLSKQDDVRLYRTNESYAEAAGGMTWINHLIKKHSKEEDWCIFVDTDEFLVYPQMKKYSLSDLLGEREFDHFDAIGGIMLDMFPKSFSEWTVEAGEHFTKSSIYFDNAYRIGGLVYAPYFVAYGGVRERLFNAASTYLVKTPIVRGGGHVQYLNSHIVSPCRVGGLTVALKHYKIAPDFRSRAEVEISRGQYFRSGVQWNSILEEAIYVEMADDLRGPDTIRFEDYEQLVKLGLMRCPDRLLDAPAE